MKQLSKPMIIAVLIALLTATAALAASTVILGGYQVDFIEVVRDGNNTIWTYAITADGDEPYGLSHWTLDLDLSCGYTITAPSGSYTTPTSYVPQGGTDICASLYDCQASTYIVSQGVDPTTGLSGIKFEDPNPSLSAPGTHIFSFTLASSDPRKGDIDVAVKAGNGYEIGTIDGPVCYPTALTMANLSARSDANGFLMTSVLVAALAFASLIAALGLRLKQSLAF